MSGSKSQNQSQQQATSQQSLDPAIKGALLGNYGAQSAWANAANPQYGGQLVAPMNATQDAGNQGLLDIANSGVGNDTLNSAIGSAGGVANYDPSTVTAGQLATTNLSPYLDPYTKDVTNTTLADLTRQNQMANVGNDASATSAGAFGGDRSAVLDALTNEGYARTGAQTLAGLNQANFSQAQGAASQDIASRLQAAEANQNAGLQGANTRLSGANSLANMSAQQLGQQTALQNLIRQVGQQYQTQAQNVDTANQGNFQQTFGNSLALRQLINQALGLMGNPVLGQSQSTGSSSGSSFGFNSGLSYAMGAA